MCKTKQQLSGLKNKVSKAKNRSSSSGHLKASSDSEPIPKDMLKTYKFNYKMITAYTGLSLYGIKFGCMVPLTDRWMLTWVNVVSKASLLLLGLQMRHLGKPDKLSGLLLNLPVQSPLTLQ